MPVQIPAKIQEEESINNRKVNALDIEIFSTDSKYKNKTYC